eukprot:9416612-Karenia_brevis.AAC.1
MHQSHIRTLGANLPGRQTPQAAAATWHMQLQGEYRLQGVSPMVIHMCHLMTPEAIPGVQGPKNLRT